jgi:hypothetical protein
MQQADDPAHLAAEMAAQLTLLSASLHPAPEMIQ